MNSRTQISTSVSEETRRQADALIEDCGYSMRDVLTVAIQQLHQATHHPQASTHVITEVERAACTILNQTHPDHPGLRAYVQALVTDAQETRNIQTYIDADADLAATCAHLGYVGSSTGRDTPMYRALAISAIIDERPQGHEPSTGDEAWAAAHDRNILILAHAVTDYRATGRPTGDQTHTIQGMGSPLLTVSTSLAAAIYQYHHATIELWACRDDII